MVSCNDVSFFLGVLTIVDKISIITVKNIIAVKVVKETEATFGRSIFRKLLTKGYRRPSHQASNAHALTLHIQSSGARGDF